MNAKGFCILLCSIVVFWSIPIFADCSSPERQYIEKQVDIRNEILTFNTIVQKHEIGYRCYPGLSITIKESRAGTLRDGDVIYFKTGTGQNDDKYLEIQGIDITSKGVSVEEVKLSEGNEDCFAVRISRGNKNSLAQIDMSFLGGFHGVTYKDEYTPTFSLYLDADNTKENNLFSGEQDILLNEQFLIVTGGVAEKKKRDNEIQQKLKEGLPTMIFSPESHTVTLDAKEIPLKHNVYINEKGTAMLSLEDFEYIMNQLNDIGASARHIVYHDYDNNEKYEYSITAGINDCSIYCEDNRIDFGYNKEKIENVLEKKNDVFYIPLRIIAKILDMENHIYWDNNTKTVTISK